MRRRKKAARHSFQRLRPTFSQLKAQRIVFNHWKAALQARLYSYGSGQRDIRPDNRIPIRLGQRGARNDDFSATKLGPKMLDELNEKSTI
jgi:hypothetical protein